MSSPQDITSTTRVPATPSRPAAASLYTPNSSIPEVDEHAVARLGQESQHEASPASTYGETATGGSVPATPFDSSDPNALIQLLHSTALNSGNRNSDASDAPVPQATEGSSQFPSIRGHEPIVSIEARAHGRSASSPALRRIRDGNRGDETHVEFIMTPNEADPFLSSQEHGANREVVVHHPRLDRGNMEITGDNAQAIFSPNACVFVANLASARTDEQLEFSVTRAFEGFGRSWVKIKRDMRAMPYAFVQYENVADSERAIHYGRSLVIDGRQCRTERARVNRSLYLSRVTGAPISAEEAQTIMNGHGDVEKMWYNTPTDKEMFRLQEGIWIQFAFFQDCRDAQAAFKDSVEFRLEQPAMPEEMRIRVGRALVSPVTRHSSDFALRAHQAAAEAGRSSIFVGNLPGSVTPTTLRNLFSSCGVIRGLEIISKPGIQAINIFAFVDFCNDEEARRAVLGQHFLDGFRLRVEIKESPRRVNDMLGTTGSPVSRRRTSGPNTPPRDRLQREAGVARALAAGVHPATVMQIFDPNGVHGLEIPSTVQATMSPPVYATTPWNASFYPTAWGPYGSPGAPPNDVDINVQNGQYPANHQLFAQLQAPQAHHLPAPQFPPATSAPQLFYSYPAPAPYMYPPPGPDAGAPLPPSGETQ